MMKYIMQQWIRRIVKPDRRRDNYIPTSTGLQGVKNVQKFARRYEGKLLLREEIPLTNEVFQELLTNHYFTATPSMHISPIVHQCMRCSHKQIPPFTLIPCKRCHKTHPYCRHCIEMGRVLSCEPLYFWTGERYKWFKHTSPCSWEGKLTTAQQYASDIVTKHIANKKDLLVWAVTGAGKTEMLFQGLSYALKSGQRICIASPRADVVRELLPRLQAAFQSIHIQGLYGGSRDHDGTSQLIISTTHQLFRYQDAFDVLIIDEIDAFPFHSDTLLQYAADRAKKQDAPVIYLTATPRERQRWQIATRRLDHLFVPGRFHGQPLIIPKWVQVHSLTRDLQAGKLPKQMQAWLKNRSLNNRQLLIFVPTIHYLHHMLPPIKEFMLTENLISSIHCIDSVHAEDSKRKEKVEAFREKAITVLLTTTILERGVTFPSIDVLVLHSGHHIFDEAALVQIAGRVGRSPADPFGEVLFLHNGKTNAMVRTNQSIKEMNILQKRQLHKK